MLLLHLRVLSALLMLLLATGHWAAAAALLRGSGGGNGRADSRSLLELAGHHPRVQLAPGTGARGYERTHQGLGQ